ncbi:MAG: glycosyltransferase family 4 protein [Myxococcota bacterium]
MGRLLIVTQVFPPDATAVGQYLHDLAVEVAEAGRPVTVVTADRDYSDPSRVYPPFEYRGKIEIIRVPASSFGKASLAHRLAGAASFLAQAMARGLRLDDVDRTLVSTSPPLAGAVGWLLKTTRGIPCTYWVMDLNPDQAVAMGLFGERHPAVRAFDLYNARVLKGAQHVVALDEFMAARIRAKYERPVEVIPPWPLQAHASPVAHSDNGFRKEQGWDDKTVIMFSGNMSPTSPIDTVVDAAYRLKDRTDLVFAFIGGGAGKEKLTARLQNDPLQNAVVLPYHVEICG